MRSLKRRSLNLVSALGAAGFALSGCVATGGGAGSNLTADLQTGVHRAAVASETGSSSSSQTRPVAPPKSPVEVLSAQFGVFGADPNGRRFLYETDHVPGIIAAPFGWYIIFKTDRPTVVWREEFELPEEPPTWGPGEAIGAYTISPDRKTAVTERIIPARMGFVANEWRYAPGDPIGNHKIRVFIDGMLIREFAFAIEEGPPEQRKAPQGSPNRSNTSI